MQNHQQNGNCREVEPEILNGNGNHSFVDDSDANDKALESALEKSLTINGNGSISAKKAKSPWKRADHPFVPKAEQPFVGKLPDGTWGPTGLYGGRVKETKLLEALRSAVKASRLKRVEEVLAARCQRVQCLFENLCDPANGAACLRTMEAFGLLVAHAVESYEPFKVPGGITMNADKVSF